MTVDSYDFYALFAVRFCAVNNEKLSLFLLRVNLNYECKMRKHENTKIASVLTLQYEDHKNVFGNLNCDFGLATAGVIREVLFITDRESMTV